MKKLRLFFLLILVFFISNLSAQDFQQNIRGIVLDKFTQTPLPGASIHIKDSNPTKGTSSDNNGRFELKNIQIGRYVLVVSFVGYEPLEIPNVNVTSGREIVLRIEMIESVEQLNEVTVVAGEDNMKTENEMVTLSGRTFAIEETQRFAGARNDVARMATKLPGVRGTDDAVNDIVIRGNAPSGLLWRMEGVDIPNPNHFGKTGATGGPVSMINNNVMRNSDFLTAAFPAQYGNALSGVFDIKLRNGNSHKHEFLAQVGFNGFEVAGEGPISKETNASYLVDYRYSVLGFMKAIGLNFGTGAAVPEYQDITFKLNFPLKNQQSISFFGLGGISKINFVKDPEEIDEDDFYAEGKTNTYSRTTTGVVGLNYYKGFGRKTLLNIQASAGTLIDGDYVDTLDDNFNASAYYGMDFRNSSYSANVHLSTKFSSRSNLRVGIYNTLVNLNMLDSVFNYDQNQYITVTDVKGETFFIRPYAEWQFRPSTRWTINAGLHSQYFDESGGFSLEPRLGVNYALNEKNQFKVAYGLHSQSPAIYLYFRNVTLNDGSIYNPNKNLGFTKSHHFVVGWDYTLTKDIRLRVESYYQSIFDAVVEQNSSSFSLINVGSFGFSIPDSLNNNGFGDNYGIDITLEQFMKNGMYYMGTFSLYQSKYIGSDKVQRNTAWAGDFVFNALGGKEFVLGKKKEKKKYRTSITTDASITYAGGQRYTPIDLTASATQGRTVLQDDEAYTLQYPNYFRADLRIGFRMQGKKTSQEISIDIQNVTNHQNIQISQYNPITGEIDFIYQIGILPIMQYKLEF